MNEKKAKNLLMDYLYREISEADQKKLETYLQNHPKMQQELHELSRTRLTLQQMPEPQHQPNIAIVNADEQPDRSWKQNVRALIPHSAWRRAALAAAASLIFLMVAASVVNLSIQSDQSGFSVNFGYAQQPAVTTLSEEQADAIIQQLRQENAAILTEYADMLNKHNSQQLQQVVEHFERQRMEDLQLIDQAFNEYQEQTKIQLQQTNQVLGEVIQTMASSR